MVDLRVSANRFVANVRIEVRNAIEAIRTILLKYPKVYEKCFHIPEYTTDELEVAEKIVNIGTQILGTYKGVDLVKATHDENVVLYETFSDLEADLEELYSLPGAESDRIKHTLYEMRAELGRLLDAVTTADGNIHLDEVEEEAPYDVIGHKDFYSIVNIDKDKAIAISELNTEFSNLRIVDLDHIIKADSIESSYQTLTELHEDLEDLKDELNGLRSSDGADVNDEDREAGNSVIDGIIKSIETYQKDKLEIARNKAFLGKTGLAIHDIDKKSKSLIENVTTFSTNNELIETVRELNDLRSHLETILINSKRESLNVDDLIHASIAEKLANKYISNIDEELPGIKAKIAPVEEPASNESNMEVKEEKQPSAPVIAKEDTKKKEEKRLLKMIEGFNTVSKEIVQELKSNSSSKDLVAAFKNLSAFKQTLSTISAAIQNEDSKVKKAADTAIEQINQALPGIEEKAKKALKGTGVFITDDESAGQFKGGIVIKHDDDSSDEGPSE